MDAASLSRTQNAATCLAQKAYLHGFCVDLLTYHNFTCANDALHVKPAGAYQAQFYWHDGEGRLTLDPVSTRTVVRSERKSICHSFSYHGLPYII